MTEKHGVKGLMHNGIFITEKNIPNAEVVQHIQVDISRQNSNLKEIRDQIAARASGAGVTTVANFKYGQRKHSVLNYLNPFRWDSESWYGEGDAVRT